MACQNNKRWKSFMFPQNPNREKLPLKISKQFAGRFDFNSLCNYVGFYWRRRANKKKVNKLVIMEKQS